MDLFFKYIISVNFYILNLQLFLQFYRSIRGPTFYWSNIGPFFVNNVIKM